MPLLVHEPSVSSAISAYLDAASYSIDQQLTTLRQEMSEANMSAMERAVIPAYLANAVRLHTSAVTYSYGATYADTIDAVIDMMDLYLQSVVEDIRPLPLYATGDISTLATLMVSALNASIDLHLAGTLQLHPRLR